MASRSLVSLVAFLPLATAIGCSSTASPGAAGAEAGAPTEDAGPASPSAEAGADGATGATATEVPIDGFCDLYEFYQVTIPANPDLTGKIPGSAWHGTSGCVAREPYWRRSQNEITYGPSDAFKYVGASGTARIALSFGAGNTVLMRAVLDYTAQIEIELGVYTGLDKSCDDARSSLLNMVVVGNTGPFQEGLVPEKTSCTAKGASVCGCSIAVHYERDITNEGFAFLGKNAGVKLTSEEELRFVLATGLQRFPIHGKRSSTVHDEPYFYASLAQN
jgi:hypothetical protein